MSPATIIRAGRVVTGEVERAACAVLRDGLIADVVDPATLLHRNPITPYAGRTLYGVVEQTWLAGQRIGGERRGEMVTRGGRR